MRGFQTTCLQYIILILIDSEGSSSFTINRSVQGDFFLGERGLHQCAAINQHRNCSFEKCYIFSAFDLKADW